MLVGPVIFSILTGYIFGSIPFGLWLTRWAGINLRMVGSGNIGATNVLRTGRKDLALATLFLDSCKAGLVAILIGKLIYPTPGLWVSDLGFLAGAAAFIGHCYPVWLKFKGGKGVATYTGLLLFTTWQGLLVAAPVWLGMVYLTRISSAGALSAAILTPIGAWLLGERLFIVIGLAFLSILVFWTHRANLQRLIAGTEPVFGKGR